MQYLKDIIKSEVFFWHNNNFILVSYANVDYGRNIDIKRQIFGLIHKLGKSSIKWSNKR